MAREEGVRTQPCRGGSSIAGSHLCVCHGTCNDSNPNKNTSMPDIFISSILILNF